MNRSLEEQFEELLDDLLSAAKKIACTRLEHFEGLEIILEKLEAACVEMEDELEDEDE